MREIVFTVLMVIPGFLAAQQRVLDAGILRFYQSGNEVGRESFERTPTTLRTETRVPLADLRLTYVIEYDDADRLARMEATAYSLSGDSVVRQYTAVAAGDSLHMTQTDASGSSRSWSALASPDAAIGSQTVAGVGDLVLRAARRDRTFNVWSPEQNATSEMTVTFSNDTARVQAGPMLIIARLDAAGRAGSYSIPASALTVERAGPETLEPLAGVTRAVPDYSARPSDPYVAEEVRVPVQPNDADTFELAGTLALPKNATPPYPVVVMITGSGGQDRDESLWPLVPEYRPFRQIAGQLAASGIATLRVDDRGVGVSGGDAATATTEDLAGDTQAQIEWLRTRADIDADLIVLVGHSEGGVIAPMLAAEDRDIRAIVILAGTAKPGADVLRDQVFWPLETVEGLSPEDRESARTSSLQQLETMLNNANPWLTWFRDYDPREVARRVTQPTLILHGELDRQVTVGQADMLAMVMKEGGNDNVEVHKYPGLNHLFLPALIDGSPSEYAVLPDTEIPSQVLNTLSGWIVRTLRLRS